MSELVRINDFSVQYFHKEKNEVWFKCGINWNKPRCPNRSRPRSLNKRYETHNLTLGPASPSRIIHTESLISWCFSLNRENLFEHPNQINFSPKKPQNHIASVGFTDLHRERHRLSAEPRIHWGETLHPNNQTTANQFLKPKLKGALRKFKPRNWIF